MFYATDAQPSVRHTMRLPVLLYHNVGPLPSEAWRGLTVTLSAFDRQIAMLLRAGYHGISCAAWLDALTGSGALPHKPELITFEDAYTSLSEHALPTILDAGWSATVFVATGLIGRKIHRQDPTSPVGLAVLSRGDIPDWAHRGIEFGGHSRTHRDLTSLSDAVLRDEIHGGRRDLEAVSGKVVRAFAYPYGKVDARVVSVVREAYSAAFTVEPGVNDEGTDLFAMRRSMVQPYDSAVEVWVRAAAGWNPVEVLRTSARRWWPRATA
jgi:peptidoglycan/xylan/chitin deacetylase (PgdA/CDA1 family)